MAARAPGQSRRGAVSRADFLATSGKDPEWLQGYASALAAVVRAGGRAELVRAVLAADAVTLSHLQSAGVEPFDLEPLRRALA
jgi:hypothetical protein